MTLLEQPMTAGFGPYPFSIPATDTDAASSWHVEAQRAEDGGHVFQARILLHAQT